MSTYKCFAVLILGLIQLSQASKLKSWARNSFRQAHIARIASSASASRPVASSASVGRIGLTRVAPPAAIITKAPPAIITTTAPATAIVTTTTAETTPGTTDVELGMLTRANSYHRDEDEATPGTTDAELGMLTRANSYHRDEGHFDTKILLQNQRCQGRKHLLDTDNSFRKCARLTLKQCRTQIFEFDQSHTHGMTTSCSCCLDTPVGNMASFTHPLEPVAVYYVEESNENWNDHGNSNGHDNGNGNGNGDDGFSAGGFQQGGRDNTNSAEANVGAITAFGDDGTFNVVYSPNFGPPRPPGKGGHGGLFGNVGNGNGNGFGNFNGNGNGGNGNGLFNSGIFG